MKMIGYFNRKTCLFILIFVFSILTALGVNENLKKKNVLVKTINSKMIAENGNKFIIISNDLISKDKRGVFVYKVVGDYGLKTYLKYKKIKNAVKVYHGLNNGDEIIDKVLIKIGDDFIKGKFISEFDRVLIKVMYKNRRGSFVERAKKIKTKKGFKTRKINFEISMGYMKNIFDDFYLKDKSYEELLKQYGNISGLTFSSVGTYPELSLFKPIELSINYRLSNDIYIIGGIGFSSSESSSDVNYKIMGTKIKELYDYGFSHKLSYSFPYAGVAKRFNDFYIYANIGINIVNYNYEMSKNFSEGTYWEKINEKVKAIGKAVSLVIGLKYKKRIYKKIMGFVKFEYKLSKISSLNADFTLKGSNSEGKTLTDNYSGLIYTYSMNPYNSSKIDTWAVYDKLPDNTWTDDFEKLMLKLSAVKISVGLSF